MCAVGAGAGNCLPPRGTHSLPQVMKERGREGMRARANERQRKVERERGRERKREGGRREGRREGGREGGREREREKARARKRKSARESTAAARHYHLQTSPLAALLSSALRAGKNKNRKKGNRFSHELNYCILTRTTNPPRPPRRVLGSMPARGGARGMRMGTRVCDACVHPGAVTCSGHMRA